MPKMTVSIIDDDEAVRIALDSLVRSCGYPARTFGSAEQFLDDHECSASECVICDIHLPGKNGIELKLDMIAQGIEVPIIHITADEDEKIRAVSRASGAFGFLIKPFDDASLISLIEQVARSQ